jgi:moderate conductance mechanosensitive channel
MNDLEQTVQAVLKSAFNFRTLVIFAVALSIAYILSRLLSFGIKKIAHIVGHYGDIAKTSERTLRLRRAETYLSVAIALVRVTTYVLAIIIAWLYTHPQGVEPLTVIGASTIFFVLAGATLTPTLRDITSGSLMILEKWYNVGDFITIDPYYEESGIVERINLRSTRIRKLNGEVTWIHNQYIQRVSVAPRGVRTMAIDLFVNNEKRGQQLVEHLKRTLHVDPTMLARPLQVYETRKLDEELFEITIIAEIPPGRDWLLDKVAVDLLERYDKKQKETTLLYEPIIRYADTAAQRRFKRAMTIKPSEGPRPKAKINLAKPLGKTTKSKKQERPQR